jgi:hypothetical protein
MELCDCPLPCPARAAAWWDCFRGQPGSYRLPSQRESMASGACLDRRSAMPKHQAPRSWRVRYCKLEPARAGLRAAVAGAPCTSMIATRRTSAPSTAWRCCGSTCTRPPRCARGGGADTRVQVRWHQHVPAGGAQRLQVGRRHRMIPTWRCCGGRALAVHQSRAPRIPPPAIVAQEPRHLGAGQLPHQELPRHAPVDPGHRVHPPQPHLHHGNIQLEQALLPLHPAPHLPAAQQVVGHAWCRCKAGRLPQLLTLARLAG